MECNRFVSMHCWSWTQISKPETMNASLRNHAAFGDAVELKFSSFCSLQCLAPGSACWTPGRTLPTVGEILVNTSTWFESYQRCWICEEEILVACVRLSDHRLVWRCSGLLA